MKQIFVNKQEKYDSKRTKARAVIEDENKNIYVINMNDTFILPGGTVEENENPKDTLIRELKEELGLDINTAQEWLKVDYYHSDFPKYKQEGTELRLNEVYYYLLKVNSNQIGESHFTDFEKNHNTKVEKYQLQQIFNLLEIPNNDKYKKFDDVEIKIVLRQYLDVDNTEE